MVFSHCRQLIIILRLGMGFLSEYEFLGHSPNILSSYCACQVRIGKLHRLGELLGV